MATDSVMEGATDCAEQTVANSKVVARRFLTIGENRLELFMMEAQEERERIMRAILLDLGAVAFGFLAAVALGAAIVVLMWEVSPVVVFLTVTVFHGAAAAILSRRFTFFLRNWQNLPATFDRLGKDRECLEKFGLKTKSRR